MLKKIIIILTIICFVIPIFAQEIRNDIIEIKHSRKSVKKAMILSSLFPGAGQFYADKTSLTTYIFPIIEIGLIAGYFHFTSQGDDETARYEDYADLHYHREQQVDLQSAFFDDETGTQNSSYNNHFRLDGISDGLPPYSITQDNTQHFYEDIGKYNKYIFGWDDWYDIYYDAADSPTADWIWGTDANGNFSRWTWLGNEPINTDNAQYLDEQEMYDNNSGLYSYYRDQYIGMRQDAEDHYDNARLMTFGLAINHIVSAIDAVRLTKKYNLEYLTQNDPVEIKVTSILINNEISPAIVLTKRF